MKLYKMLLRVVVSFGLIGLLLYIARDDLHDIKMSLLGTDRLFFFLLFLFYLGVLVISSFRLKWVMAVQKVHLTLIDAAALNLVGHFFSFFLPTAIGGDVVKAHFASQHSRNKLGSYTAVFVDRFLGLITIVIIATFSLLFFGGTIYSKVRIAIFVLLFASIVAALILLNRNLAKRLHILRNILKFLKLHTQIETVYNAINIYKNHRLVIASSLALSLFIQSLSFYIIYLLGKALAVDLSLRFVFFAMPLVSFMGMLPSLGGLGFRESGFLVFFSPVIGREKAFSLGLLWLGILILVNVVGGIIYIVKGDFRVKLKEIEHDR